MKLRDAILSEASKPKTYEDFFAQITEAIKSSDFSTFQKLVKYAMSAKKYDWFGQWYKTVDNDGDISKKMFKALTF